MNGNSQRLRDLLGYMLRGYVVSTAISIVLSQLFLYAFVLLSLPRLKSALTRNDAAPLIGPIGCWMFALILSAAVSVQPLRSISEIMESAAYFFLPFAVCDYLCRFESMRERTDEICLLILMLAVGQGVAALDALLVASLSLRETLGLPGPVTESGQLALVIPALLGLLLALREREGIKFQRVAAFLLFFSIVAIGWGGKIAHSGGWLFQIAGVAGAVFALYNLNTFSSCKRLIKPTMLDERIISLSLLSFVAAAFLFNLKRGPWFGVLIAFLAIGYLLNRKIGLRTLVLALFAVIVFAPVRDRLMNFAADFTISGGRQQMWSLGLELLQRFPLGVGLKNADFMRTLNPYLPPTHRHLHNNLLNVAVELGYLGLIFYVWWMIEAIRLGFRWASVAQDSTDGLPRRLAVIAVCIGGAILSWQFAGVVEYNFGDAEIRMIAFFLMGILLAINGLLSVPQRSSP